LTFFSIAGSTSSFDFFFGTAVSFSFARYSSFSLLYLSLSMLALAWNGSFSLSGRLFQTPPNLAMTSLWLSSGWSFL